MENHAPLKKLVITCGGTGGHFYPGLSIARQFVQEGGDVKLLLSGIHAPAQLQIAIHCGIDAVMLPRMPHPKKHFWQFLRGFWGGWRQAAEELDLFKPDAMLSMGSFASLPAVLAARKRHVPLFLHDGNARIGRANRFFSRFARFLGTAFPAVNGKALRCEVKTVGMPLRPELARWRELTKEEAMAKLNERFECTLQPGRRTLLIMGGSQGAAIFNQVLPAALNALGRQDFQVLHLAGPGKLKEASLLYGDATYPVLVIEKSEDMAYFLAAADWVISRSGGSTVAELACFGKPALLIPYPAAMEHHQDDNADFLVRAGAARKIANAELDLARAQNLLSEILDVAPETERQMRAAALSCAQTEAAAAMLKEIAARLS